MELNEQLEFITKLFIYVDESRTDRLLFKAQVTANPKIRWKKIEKWLEDRLKKNFSQTPREIASQALFYMKMNTRMTPLMISLARKVKKKIYMRIKRQQERKSSTDEQHSADHSLESNNMADVNPTQQENINEPNTPHWPKDDITPEEQQGSLLLDI